MKAAIVNFFNAAWAKIWIFLCWLDNFISNDKLADGLMRWPRPVAFTLLIVLMIVGWHNPATLIAFAKGLSALPDRFWEVVFIILGSIATTKAARDFRGFVGGAAKAEEPDADAPASDDSSK